MLRPIARSHARRGAVLIVVLAMLVLFAVLGLSFVLYSEAQLSAAKGVKQSRNEDTRPNPQLAAEAYLGGLVYDVGDTNDDLANPIRGHSLARSKYGQDPAGAKMLPFNAGPMQPEPGFNWNGITDSRQVVRHTWDTGTNSVFDPERFYNGAALRNDPSAALTGTYAGKNYPFTYPDRHDYYLAFQDPSTGRIELPSFHRPDLGSWDPNSGASYFENQGTAGKFRTLRPRAADGHANFPPVPPNADGTYTGDVQNLKFTSGAQRNDSLWMDAGGPVLQWRGKNYKAMVAPLVLDLSSRVDISIAGNRKYGQTFTAGVGNNDGTTGGSEGLGPWEIDPQQLGLTAADVQALVGRRQGNSAHPPRDPYTAANSTLRVNGGLLPPAYAPQDVDGNGGANDPFTLSPSGGYSMFPTYGGRYATTPAALAAELANHGSQFNPLAYPRGVAGQPGGFGHDDLVRILARYSDPKGRATATASVPTGLGSLTPAADTAAARQARALVTTFSVCQRWTSVVVNTTAGAQVRLGPVDLNRPLPDYRKNPALPLSPLNIWPVGSTEYNAAHAARHALARDIYVRLCAADGVLTSGSAAYNPATESVTNLAPDNMLVVASLLNLAQHAVCAVDAIDNDDLTTAFVFDPLPPSNVAYAADPSLDPVNFAPAEMGKRVVLGTELPRLVLNEVYAGVFSDREEEANAPPGNRSTRPLKRRWWIELHNPTPPGPPGSPARSDGGAARLRYVPNVTQLPDPVTGVVGNYAGPDFNPYRIEVGELVGFSFELYPFSWALSKYGSVASVDLSLTTKDAVKVRIDSFVHDATAPSAAATLTGDDLYKVLPVTAASGAVGGNQGYYVIGPRDPFPAGGVTNTLSLPDAPAGIPTTAAPVNALSYEVTPAGRGPTEDEIRAQVEDLTETSVWEVPSSVYLRRLMDPYRPAQENAALLGYNPYVVVDYQSVDTRDRALYNSAGGGRAPQSREASTGRKYPFSSGPSDDINIPGTLFKPQMAAPQVNAGANPPHTFFALNNPADNARGTAPNTHGFEWYVHQDRQLVSLPEVARVLPLNPSNLTSDYTYSAWGYGMGYDDPNLIRTWRLGSNLGIVDVGSRLPGVPLGGREPGRLNLNTINSPAVVNALFGNTSGNHFPLTNPGLPGAVWNHLSPAAPPASPAIARTPNRVPRATIYEGGADRPFEWGGTAPYTTTTSTGGWNMTDSPAWRYTTDPPSGTRLFSNPFAPHMQQQMEPLRKVWNNITPVSDGFLVLMTVAFFEVENAGPWGAANPPQFGRELFDKVPGDLRAQFGGVIDRSQLATHVAAVDPATGWGLGTFNPVASDAANNPVPRGVQSRLVADAPVGGPIVIEAIPPGNTRPDGSLVPAGMCSILGDGVVYTIQPNTRFRVGYGDAANSTGDGEWVGVVSLGQRQLRDANGVMQNVPGQVTINIGASTRFHGGSSPVGNVVLGHPGPQPAVTLDQLRRRGVVPYFTRLDP